MKHSGKTSMDAGESRFHTTHWSVILAARTEDEDQRKEIVSEITIKYWRPVYCYLRRKGFHDADAKDLTQGFFCEIVLDRELIQHADQTKGRFRTLLLTALERYLKIIRVQLKKQLLIQVKIGKKSMAKEEVFENMKTVVEYIVDQMPHKYNNIKSMFLKTTMGHPVKIDEQFLKSIEV